MSFLDISLNAVEKYGFSVIPRDAVTKLPMKIEGKMCGAFSKTKNRRLIEQWADLIPEGSNYSIVADDNTTILESDDEAEFRRLLRKHSTKLFGTPRELPTTLTSYGQPNHPHWFYKRTPCCNRNGMVVPGILEWRNINSYVAGFGSKHHKGGFYTLVNPEQPLAEFPEWLVEVLESIKAAAPPRDFGRKGGSNKPDRDGYELCKQAYLESLGNPESFLDEDEPLDFVVGDGGQHYTAYSIAAGLLHNGERDEEEILGYLERFWDLYCTSRSYRKDSEGNDVELQPIVVDVLKRKPCYLNFDDYVPEPEFIDGLCVAGTQEGLDALIAARELRRYKKEKEQEQVNGTFKFSKVLGLVTDYLLAPRSHDFDGWAGRGRIHIIAGPSGSGKTTIMAPLLLDQWEGKTVFGHQGKGLRPLLIFADRGKLSNEETLLRLGLTATALPIEYISDGLDDAAVNAILRLIEKQPELPQVVYIEGADELTTKVSDSAAVARFMNGIRKIAEHYHISFILSLGAPKSKPKDQHTLVRDRVFGSEKWARKSDMILSVMIVGDGTGKDVNLSVQFRNAPAEKFEMEFKGGRLVQKESSEEVIDPTEAWAAKQEWFTRAAAVKGLKEFCGQGQSTTYRRIFSLVCKKKLDEREKDSVTEFRLRRAKEEKERQTANS